MSFSSVAMAVIDTMEFQRLREISQLGIAEFVFPGGTQTRFDHSLGTSYLGKTFIQTLARRQPELGISSRELLCVELAGLCHDLGHGPFSHLWEQFYERCCALNGVLADWHHEKTSVTILRYLLQKNRILQRFASEINEDDVRMIELMILGRPPENSPRRFLYQIINNPDSGLDVDKWDYFYRDAQNLGVKINFEYSHILREIAVFEYDGKLQVCFRDKSFPLIFDAFDNRMKLHKKAYQHPKSRIIEEMVIEALLQCEQDSGESFWGITRAVACDEPSSESLEDFIQLTELKVRLALKRIPLYRAILARSTDPLMYKYAGIVNHEELIQDRFGELLDRHSLTTDEVCVLKVNAHMGKQSNNPMDSVLFFKKGSKKPEKLPSHDGVRVTEKALVIALRRTDPEKLGRLKAVLDEYCGRSPFQNEY